MKHNEWEVKFDMANFYVTCMSSKGQEVIAILSSGDLVQKSVNARLIAAAPDLLIACKNAVYALEYTSDPLAKNALHELILAVMRAEKIPGMDKETV